MPTNALPQTGFVGLPQTLSIIAVSCFTWSAWIKAGKVRIGTELSPSIADRRVEEIAALIATNDM